MAAGPRYIASGRTASNSYVLHSRYLAVVLSLVPQFLLWANMSQYFEIRHNAFSNTSLSSYLWLSFSVISPFGCCVAFPEGCCIQSDHLTPSHTSVFSGMICHTCLSTHFYPNLSFSKFVPHESLTLPHFCKSHAHTHTESKNPGIKIRKTIILDRGYS
jgi:hypothetical protein